MRPNLALPLTLALALALTGCSKDAEAPSSAAASPPAAQAADPPTTPTPSLAAATPRVEARKIIRNAELELSVSSPSTAQRRAAEIAEQMGGYLVSSDASADRGEDGAGPASVKVVLRVDSQKFGVALDELKKLGKAVGSETIGSKDVTEEWVDLEARIKTQKKLEEQYVEIMKSASKVEDMLAVQKQLAEVRGEIEKLEGRRRLLDNQVALSTITATFQAERPLVSVSQSAFGRAAKRAGADIVNVGAGIIVGIIRLFGVMLPVTLLVLLPLFLVGRFTVRRLMRVTAPAGH